MSGIPEGYEVVIPDGYELVSTPDDEDASTDNGGIRAILKGFDYGSV